MFGFKSEEYVQMKQSEFMAFKKAVSDNAAQIRCLGSGGHEWEYTRESCKCFAFAVLKATYVFKCSKCGNEKSFTLDELTKKEVSALKTLGVIKEAGNE